MAITNTWSIITLDRETADGYVYQAHYSVLGNDGTYTTKASGSVKLEKPGTLVPYADLTESTVVGWVKAKLNSEKAADGSSIDNVAKIEDAIAANISEQKAPTKASGKPWS